MTHHLARGLCHSRAGQKFDVAGIEYKLAGKLGDGAAGIVRKAERVSDGEPIAVKILAPDPKYIEEAAFDDVLARFRREGVRGAKLAHPSLLKIFAYSENREGESFQTGTPKNPFLVMERVVGGTLEHYIQRMHPHLKGRLTFDEDRLRIAVQIGEALSYLHRRGVIHRDVKPSNIFLSSKDASDPTLAAKLGDFGVVKWGDFHASVTTGTLTTAMHPGLGTLKYMSPDQALRPKDVTVRADVFSFGVTLFELFTGRILPTFHHVAEIMTARDMRGTTMSRWYDLGMPVGVEEHDLAELILDMHRRTASSRPSMDTVVGRLSWALDRRDSDR